MTRSTSITLNCNNSESIYSTHSLHAYNIVGGVSFEIIRPSIPSNDVEVVVQLLRLSVHDAKRLMQMVGKGSSVGHVFEKIYHEKGVVLIVYVKVVCF